MKWIYDLFFLKGGRCCCVVCVLVCVLCVLMLLVGDWVLDVEVGGVFGLFCYVEICVFMLIVDLIDLVFELIEWMYVVMCVCCLGCCCGDVLCVV